MKNELFMEEELYAIARGTADVQKHISQRNNMKKILLSSPSHTYCFSFGLLRKILIKKMEGICEMEACDDLHTYSLKKISKTYLDGIGITSINFSPIWTMAILSGDKVTQKMVLNLLKNKYQDYGFLDEAVTIDSLTDLVDVLSSSIEPTIRKKIMRASSKQFAGEINDDILSVMKISEFNKLVVQMTDIWHRMKLTSISEGISIERLSGIMTMDAMKSIHKVGVTYPLHTIQGTIRKHHNAIFNSYRQSLDKISGTGKGISILSHTTLFIRYYTPLTKG